MPVSNNYSQTLDQPDRTRSSASMRFQCSLRCEKTSSETIFTAARKEEFGETPDPNRREGPTHSPEGRYSSFHMRIELDR